MRILVIAPPWFAVPPAGYGGIEQVVALLADGLVAEGHDVTLLAAGGSRTRAELWATFEEAPSARIGDPAVELIHVLAGYRRRDEFDVIHDHTLTGVALAAMPGGPPVVHTLHGPWTPTMAALYRQLADRVNLVAISHDQAARTPAGIELAGTIHNGIDVDAYPFTEVKGKHLAYVGRANHDKGPELAVEVARRLGCPLKMAIKVNEPAEHEYFATHIAPCCDGVEVEVVPNAEVGVRNEMVATAAAVLFPVRWPEPFGLVPLEANACGTPVVAFAEGAVPEVVTHGVSGLVVPPGDLDALCAAVGRVGELDPAACRATVRARFDASRMVAGYAALYDRVVVQEVIEVSEAASPATAPVAAVRP